MHTSQLPAMHTLRRPGSNATVVQGAGRTGWGAAADRSRHKAQAVLRVGKYRSIQAWHGASMEYAGCLLVSTLSTPLTPGARGQARRRQPARCRQTRRGRRPPRRRRRGGSPIRQRPAMPSRWSARRLCSGPAMAGRDECTFKSVDV
eukprot:64483-Chlamydomonas_euryale.AAC.5